MTTTAAIWTKQVGIAARQASQQHMQSGQVCASAVPEPASQHLNIHTQLSYATVHCHLDCCLHPIRLTCSVMGTSLSAPRMVTRAATVCGSVSSINLSVHAQSLPTSAAPHHVKVVSMAECGRGVYDTRGALPSHLLHHTLEKACWPSKAKGQSACLY